MTVAQSLDRRITIQRATTVTNEFNEEIKTWADYLTIWAAREDVSDGEKFASGGIGGFLAARFIVRHSPNIKGIRNSDRLAHEGSTWNIIGLKEGKGGRQRWIEITANVSVP